MDGSPGAVTTAELSGSFSKFSCQDLELFDRGNALVGWEDTTGNVKSLHCAAAEQPSAFAHR